MQTPTDRLDELVLDDADTTAGRSPGRMETLRRTVQPLKGARENAYEAMLECQARAEQRRALGQVVVPSPRPPAE